MNSLSPSSSSSSSSASLSLSTRYRELPEELLIEILLRLPVKSLIRFTCVCKYWYSLIKSPQFATQHLATRVKNSLRHQYDCQYLVAFVSKYNYYDYPIVQLLSCEALHISATFECNFTGRIRRPFPPKSLTWELYGPCNGIFCVHVCVSTPVIFLWNPATNEVFMPEQPRQILNFGGFGFDDETGDYKIVLFDFKGKSQLLYSLRSNSWREFQQPLLFDGKTFLDEIDRTSNGRMCSWLVYDFSSKAFGLLSFDMVAEVFLRTPIPEAFQPCYYCFMKQPCGDLFPALLCYNLADDNMATSHADVWVLNEYGPAGYWTKERSLVWPVYINIGMPRGLWKNNGILCVGNDRNLTYYNTVTKEIKSLSIHGNQLLGYTESLISIKDVCQLGELKKSSTVKASQQRTGLGILMRIMEEEEDSF